MLSYRHAFHAGNYADVLKHTALCRSLFHLVQKEGPVRYIDTHAGVGAYSLFASQAQQTGEFSRGIGALWEVPQPPPALEAYLKLVKAFNGGGLLNAYPGSPWFAQQILRPKDRLELCELHPQDFPALQRQMGGDARVHCHFEDGFARSLALMPPIERRGLVLMDPSYELKGDYQKVVEQLQQLHRRFATGVYLIWYPVVEARRIKTLCHQLKATGIRKIHRYELGISQDEGTPGMRASGMIAVNPPWGLLPDMRQALDFMLPRVELSPGSGYVICEELVGE